MAVNYSMPGHISCIVFAGLIGVFSKCLHCPTDALRAQAAVEHIRDEPIGKHFAFGYAANDCVDLFVDRHLVKGLRLVEVQGRQTYAL